MIDIVQRETISVAGCARVRVQRLSSESSSDVVQVKYTNQNVLSQDRAGKYSILIGESLAFSGSNQAREGRLVDALAVRGDEGRDTLR